MSITAIEGGGTLTVVVTEVSQERAKGSQHLSEGERGGRKDKPTARELPTAPTGSR